MDLTKRLLTMQNEKFKAFNSSLIPNIPGDKFIGIKTPQLRSIAKELYKGGFENFISHLPHKYFEEDQIHAFIITDIKDFGLCMEKLEAFLPYIDNWATCDQLSPKVFAKNKEKLLPYIVKWLADEHTYTVRFAVNMLMRHFLDDDFDIRFANAVAEINSEDYYINMVRAWYFATALAKQADSVLPFICEKRLDKWTHNKTIQKAVESRRIPDELKEQLRTLKLR